MKAQELASVVNKLQKDIHAVEKELENEGWSKEEVEKYIHGLVNSEFNK